MQSPIPANPLPDPPKTENKYPECLVLEIEGIPVLNNDPKLLNTVLSFFSNRKSQEVSPKYLELNLSIQFNEHLDFPIPGGTITFGLRRGELRLELINGKIPLEFRELAGSLELSVLRKVEEKTSHENQNTVKGSFIKKELGLETTHGNKKTEEVTEKVEYMSPQITSKGADVNPAWIFETETTEPVLKGILRKAKLAKVILEGKPCHITATFKINEKRDVQITDSSGIWLKNINLRHITPQKKRVFDTWLIHQLFLKSTFQPYLSKAVLQYDD
jgi:hypothetical protein